VVDALARVAKKNGAVHRYVHRIAESREVNT
jgi:hypothetical protein